MSDTKRKEVTFESAAKLPDLQAEEQELSVEDAESVRGGIIVQGGISPYSKITSTDSIQSFSWGVTNTGG